MSTLTTPFAGAGALDRRTSARRTRRIRVASGGTAPIGAGRARILRYAPLAAIVSTAVLVAPALAASALVRPRGVSTTLGSALIAWILSMTVTAILAGVWKRGRRGVDVVFSELLPWGFARRWHAERRLHEMYASYQAAARRNDTVRVAQLEGLARLLVIREPYTHGHCKRVANHAERIAQALHLSAASVAKVRTAALLHDVGKLYTPRAILNKPAKLTDEEFDIVKRHAVDGAEMVAMARDRELAEMVRHHHERLDGSGYPDALRGAEIPIGARILAVADTFDAFTSHRSYRRARSQREGLALLREERGTKLDGAAVDAFIHGYCPRRSIASLALLSAGLARVVSGLNPIPALVEAGARAGALLPAVGAAGLVALGPVAHSRLDGRSRPVQPGVTGAVGTHLRGASIRHSTGPVVAGAPRTRTTRGGPTAKPVPRRRPAAKPLHGAAPAPVRSAGGSAGSAGAAGVRDDAPAPAKQGPAEQPTVAPPVTVPVIAPPTVKAPPVAAPTVTVPTPGSPPPITVPAPTVPAVHTPW